MLSDCNINLYNLKTFGSKSTALRLIKEYVCLFFLTKIQPIFSMHPLVSSTVLDLFWLSARDAKTNPDKTGPRKTNYSQLLQNRINHHSVFLCLMDFALELCWCERGRTLPPVSYLSVSNVKCGE